jgi:hypothetical protein
MELDWLYGFLFFNEWGWERYIFRKHPDLKRVYGFKRKKEREKFILDYIKRYNIRHKKLILKNKTKMIKEWHEIEKRYFFLLTKIMDTGWPKKKKDITAMLSINPICPRLLKDWSFFINYKYKVKDAVEVIMHETCHFLYFKKWKELFPETKLKQCESPYIEWHLSELIAPIILNDPRIQIFLRQKAVFYEEHQKIKICGVSAPIYFSRLYEKWFKSGKTFDFFLKDAYIIIKKNEAAFK